MSLLRLSPIPRSLATISSSRLAFPFMTKNQQRLYAQSYGGGEGDPKAEDPQNQGSNPSADKEHPGPPPPSAGQGTGGGPTKKGKEGHNTQQNDSSGESKSESGSGNSAGSKSGGGAQPKIHSQAEPAEPTDDVKKHNEEFNNRHDRAQTKMTEGEDDSVGKEFWKGRGGAERNP